MKSSITAGAAGFALLGGCTSSDIALKRATATEVGQNATPDQIKLSNIDHTVVDVRWEAQTPLGTYVCSSDDAMRRPNCVKRP